MQALSDFTTIFTVRHAETDYSVQRRYAGTIDISLNKNGIKDTKEASKKLSGIHFDVVITSTLQRSIETAGYLLGPATKLVKHSCCNERNYGRMQGLTADEVKYLTPKVEFIEVGNDTHSLNPPEGESFEQLHKRAEELSEYIFKNYRGLSILVISHGVFLQQFHGLLRGLDWKQSLAENVTMLELHKFRFNGNVLVDESVLKLIDRNQVSW